MATTISTQDLIDVKRDIDDIGKAVNEKTIVSPRYGEDFKSLPMIAEEFQISSDAAEAAAVTAVSAAQSASSSANIAEAAATAATIGGKVYDTPEAGVNPVTGVADGAYFNVRSSSDESYVDEYQNIAGVPTPTGKSYPSGAALNAVKEAIIDPNTGLPSASKIKDASGLSQQNINDLSLTPYHFGGIGDGLNHPLSERYTTLAAAQAVYPFAESLNDSIDYCALRAFFDFCQANFVPHANISFFAYVHKKLFVTGSSKTVTFYGDLTVTNTQTVEEIEALIQLNVVDLRIMGKLTAIGTYDNVATRKQLAGVILGDGGSDGSGGRMYVNTINCGGFRDFGLVLINDSIFPSFDYNHNGVIGAGVGSAYNNQHTATISARTDNQEIGFTQYTELTVSSLPPNINGKYGFSNPIMLQHAGELYRVVSIDESTSKIRVYPCLNFKSTDTNVSYIYGTGCGWVGNNSGCGNFGVIQSVLCGVGFWGNSLYGATIDYAISEYCGIGFTIGQPNNAVISYNVTNAYFETNAFNFVSQWLNDARYSMVRFGTALELDLNKAVNLYSFRVAIYDTESGGRRMSNPLVSSSFYLAGEDYHVNKFESYKYDLTTSADFVLINAAGSIQLSIDIDKVKHFNIDRKLLIVAPHPAPLTLVAPTGWSFNQSAVLEETEEHLPIFVDISWPDKVLHLKLPKARTVRKGASSSRPANPSLGLRYYDTSLLPTGKPIEWNGSAWVDATGVAV